MNLIGGQLEVIMSPTHQRTCRRKAEVIRQVCTWHDNNVNLVGTHGGSSSAFTLDDNILGPDAYVVLIN
ncbi:17548_t:CDS:2, partial [Dentiscutata erythropus]